MQSSAISASRSLFVRLARPVQACSQRGFRALTGVLHKKKDDCKSLEETKKQAITCKKPDLRRKPIPPYRYGYCREEDVPMQMSCPPKSKKRGKGPCCHDQVEQKKGGCRVNK